MPSSEPKMIIAFDSVTTEAEISTIVKDAIIGNNFEIFEYDSTVYIAYFRRTNDSFVLKPILGQQKEFEVNVKAYFTPKDTNGLNLYFAYNNGSIYFFPNGTTYFTLSIDALIKNQVVLKATALNALNVFKENYFASKTAESRLPLRNHNVFFPYKSERSFYPNNLDSNVMILIRNFDSDSASLTKIGSHHPFLYHNHDHLHPVVTAINDGGTILYYTNKKSDSISVFYVDSLKEKKVGIPNTQFVAFDSTKAKDINYLRAYAYQNDVNFKIYPDSKSDAFYLIRRKVSSEENKIYELLCFSANGKLLNTYTLPNNNLNLTLSFIYDQKIHIPSSNSNYIYTYTASILP